MTIDWAFLDPWHDALCASLNKAKPTENGIEMQVSFEWSFVYDAQRKCSLLIHLEEGKPQNVLQLIQIREAIELFTVDRTVNNKAFTERFPQLTQSRDKGERKWYPSWKLYVYGAAAAHQVTWSKLFECLDPSPQFQRAIQMLEVLGLENTEEGIIFSCTGVRWVCKFDGADVYASLVHDDENDTLNGIKTHLFNAGVPLIMQLGLPPVCATQVDIWQDLRQQGLKKVDITFTIHDLTTAHSRYLTAGLVSTPINSLRINFDEETITSDEQATINAGVLLSRVYEWSHVITERMTISCKKVSKGVFAAICSTIAVRSNTTPISFNVHSVDSES